MQKPLYNGLNARIKIHEEADLVMRPYQSSSAETIVLKALWDLGPSTARKVLEHLKSSRVSWKYATVVTFLNRLEKKGCVSVDQSERAFVFSPIVSKKRLLAARTQQIIEELCDGAAGPIAMQLLRDELLTPTEIMQLQQLIKHHSTDDKGQG